MVSIKLRFIYLTIALSTTLDPIELMSQTIAPLLLPFQGRLTDSTGTPVPDGMRSILFKIYDQPSGGNAVWTGELHRTSVNGGLVNVLLGSKAKFSPDFDFNRQLYLEITVDIDGDNAISAEDPPMLPRQLMNPVPFAIRAVSAVNADYTLVAETVEGPQLFVHPENGNVGIGTTTNINAKLTITGDANTIAVETTDGSDDKSLSISGGGANSEARGGHIFLGGNERSAETGTVRIVAGDVSGGVVSIRTGAGLDRLTVDSSGNVGIGTTTPENKLEVQGGPIKASGGLIIESRTSDPDSPETGRIWLRTDL